MSRAKLVVLTCAIAATAPAIAVAQAMPVAAQAGKMLYSTGGKKLAAVYKVDASGTPQILLDGRLVSVPVATLSETDGRIETTLSRRDLLSSR